ncbi:hypothetical protein SLS60_006440 [Paraconiothyrium brasiliense]|uniref:RING-type domain-containing protein n=1 Tax=Paraconiothyrium brasiliense TaxID=300254 RepID=A0ABR3RAR0_9PLEO
MLALTGNSEPPQDLDMQPGTEPSPLPSSGTMPGTESPREERRRHHRRGLNFGQKTQTLAQQHNSGKDRDEEEADKAEEIAGVEAGSEAEESNETEDPEAVALYDCSICTGEFLLKDGIVSCAEHFICNDCVVQTFTLAAENPVSGLFPVKCCMKAPGSRRGPIVLRCRLVQHLLPPKVNEAYRRKEKEYYTPPTLKLYCVDCGSWLDPETFQNKRNYSWATCACGTSMCVGCKGAWQENHFCTNANDAKPDWLPPYSDDCRIKQCPDCRTPIEHWGACNHMTCESCRHQWCFICLLPWDGFHVDDGCPAYNDPDDGYDDEGYENNERGLHRDTGLNREGLNRKGSNLLPEQDDNIGFTHWDYDNDQDWDADENDVDHHAHHGDQYEWGAVHEPAPIVPIDPEEEAEREYRDDLEAAVPRGWDYNEPVPDEAHDLTFARIECGHNWSYRNTGNSCSVCNYTMPYFHFNCSTCGIIACDYCRSNWTLRVEYYEPEATSMVMVLEWAEQGEVPFKANKKAFWRAIQEADAVPVWSVSLMFQQYEKLLFEQQPFMYFDFGIKEMFDTIEQEMKEEEYVAEDNVGFPGNAMTFRLDTNRFAPLLW